jgi:hypothetical protein
MSLVLCNAISARFNAVLNEWRPIPAQWFEDFNANRGDAAPLRNLLPMDPVMYGASGD